MDESESGLVSAKALASILGTSTIKILKWFHDGVIPAEVAEGRVYRFDPEKVRLVLRHRAAKRAEDELRPRRRLSYFEPPPLKQVSSAPEQAPQPSVFMAEYNARKAKERETQRIARRREHGR